MPQRDCVGAAASGGKPDGKRHAVVTEPPAASILSLAEPETALALRLTLTVISPVLRTFTGAPLRTAPLATRSSTVTSPPSGNSELILSRLTTWCVGLNGFLKPRSFGRRMWIGVDPPSKLGLTW